jgi:geranylgeranyl pyrophosphate synthase
MDRAVRFWCDTFDGRILKHNSVIAEVEIAGAVIGIHSGGEGRRTWMAEYAKQHAPSNQKLLLHQYYGADDITIEQADAVRRVFVDCGAKQACSDKIAELLQEAIDSIETLNINPSSKNLFLELVHTMSDRQK